MTVSLISRLLTKQIVRSNKHRLNFQQLRFLDLQEYQSKQLLHENGLQVQRFKVVSNLNEANKVLNPRVDGALGRSRWSGFDEEIDDSDEFVIKAQVLAGGRGKGSFINSRMFGGVKLTKNRNEAVQIVENMLKDYLVTKQTGSKGVFVDKVMIAEAVRLKQEFYLAIVLDRAYEGGPIMIASPYGGMDIEEIAEKSETAIRKFTMPIDFELDLDTARRMAVAAYDLNMKDLDIIDQCATQMMRLFDLFIKLDALQIEINPLGVTSKREVICVDAKIKFDENARFRQSWLDELEEMNKLETDSREYEARKSHLNFIGLDGSIGCLVNGAGLAMATMDIIKLHGGEPANFLDVGGGASCEQITSAFRIINSDPNVKAILVNIFGGIMRCDTVAEGIIEASKRLNMSSPIVVRLEGTRVDEAKRLIEQSGLKIITCEDLDSAAQMAVSLTKL